MTIGQRERVDRCIHIISLIGEIESDEDDGNEGIVFLADRRGLIHFLRSSHSSTGETIPTRSRRTSRSATSDRRQSSETLLDAPNEAQDFEHRRVIDSFMVNRSSLQ